MKQTILALGAAAALGFAGASHAIAFFGQGNDDPGTGRENTSWPKVYDYTTMKEVAIGKADSLRQAVGGVGHMLFMPYYNTQEGTATMFNITNTDPINGKAVKVRLRGASNSDDVYDFTVLLSPGDMWAASLMHNEAGVPVLTTADNSCTLPESVNGPLKTGRLDGALGPDGKTPLDDATKQVLVSEGYIEVLNMADIPPTVYDTTATKFVGSALFADILHPVVGDQKGVPSCGASLQTLLTPSVTDMEGAREAGLGSSTGGLMGSWVILNQDKVATYSGNMTAVRAELQATGENGYGAIIFAPQVPNSIGDLNFEVQGLASLVPPGDPATWNLASYKTAAAYPYPNAGDVAVSGLTADPLLNGSWDGTNLTPPTLDPKWFDLPDMSTPLLSTISSPQQQVMALKLAHMSIYNEYLADPNGTTGTPMLSDWVISQPTRRYYAAVDYKGEKLVWNVDMGSEAPVGFGGPGAMASLGSGVEVTAPVSSNAYAGLTYLKNPFPASEHGPFACLTDLKTQAIDREEFFTSSPLGGAISPGEETKTKFCGEVFVVKFGGRSVMNAKVATIEFPKIAGTEGWAFINFGEYKKNPRRLPVVGFAATHFENPSTDKNYGATWPHRWDH